MKTLSDCELIIEFQKGNEVALEVLLKRYQREIFTFIFYKLGNEDLANDIFQDTFMKIIVTLKEGRYKDEGKFSLWAKRIAHNLVIDYYRLKAKNPKISESSYENEDYSIFDIIKEPDSNVEDQLIQIQIHQDLHRMIACLPDNQREVLELRFFKELSFKEIAEYTKSSINTTLGRVRYALINLRKMMIENQISLTR
ncbi:sigma-70 family RNA polymerase sigma factor [Elizabethkingia argentiflava]|uniref:Sigma-70 family RNA polymerase sigma factor n=1 Tax=Elizabethkingia argenteiflava TaxID=2681556 RepID=A0A845PVL0_9FLAO|nr:sigma-70 family RNA polymerase sigma factor [Elizabethkingia argenteiflava]NAW51685.1 sigma-70 family RNA polymerase sigma factor [Elizabethkingia argenteiflava]